MRIRWTRQAVRNLDAIEAWIEVDDPVVAARVKLQVARSVEILAEHPAAGRPGRVPGTRELVIPRTPYIAAYRLRGNVVEVLRVLHSAMQWPSDL